MQKVAILKNQYNQKLTPEQAAQGIQAAIENAKSLLDDAILLFNNGRYERSAALSILAIEETGKPSILRSILLEEDSKNLKKEWQNYRRHTEKNLKWILPELVSNGARHLEELRLIFNKNSDHGFLLDNLKQLSLYTDSFSNCKWSKPKQVITKEIAELVITVAKILTSKDQSPMTTKRELDIWVKYMKPVWRTDMIQMKQALINCYREAEEKGLIKEGTTREMSAFTL